MVYPEGTDLNAGPVIPGEGKSWSMDRAELRVHLLKSGPIQWIAPDPGCSKPVLKPRLCRSLSRPHLHAVFKIQSSRKPHQRYDEDRRYQYPIHPTPSPFLYRLQSPIIRRRPNSPLREITLWKDKKVSFMPDRESSRYLHRLSDERRRLPSPGGTRPRDGVVSLSAASGRFFLQG